jgi:hypothetical protein
MREITNLDDEFIQIPIKYELNISKHMKPGHFKDLYDELYSEGWYVAISLINYCFACGCRCPYPLFLEIYNIQQTQQNRDQMHKQFFRNINKSMGDPKQLSEIEKNELLVLIKSKESGPALDKPLCKAIIFCLEVYENDLIIW